jgi:hypothetical protein
LQAHVPGQKIDDPRDKGSLGKWRILPGLLRLDGRSITLAYIGRTRTKPCCAATRIDEVDPKSKPQPFMRHQDVRAQHGWMRKLILPLVLLAPLSTVHAAPKPGSALIDYDGYMKLTRDVRPYRAKRLLPLSEFRAKASRSEALLLDARSAQAFAEGHIEGAINLPFPDFTAEALAKLIGPNRNRPIYIYCNNNFSDNRRPVVTKALPLALNIQTFVNLYGYGYKNVWELADVIRMADPATGWVTGPA